MDDSRTSTRSWSEIRKAYPPDKYIHILPAEDAIFAHGAPQWRLDATVVKFSPDDLNDCYPIDKDGDETATVGLSKQALERLAAAAGISIVSQRIDGRGDLLFAEFSAYAVLATKGGEFRTTAASRVWDGRLEQEKCQMGAERKFGYYSSKGWAVTTARGRKKANACSEQERAEAIDLMYRELWIKERNDGLTKAESKAKNRAIRAILSIPSKFAYADIRDKAFVIPRWMFEPDLSDPEIKRMVIQDGLTAQRRGWFLPSPQPTSVQQIEAQAQPVYELPPPPAEVEADPEPEQDDDLPFASTIDDVDAIADAEIGAYIERAVAGYTGPHPATEILAQTTRALNMGNAEGYNAARKILRHLYKHR